MPSQFEEHFVEACKLLYANFNAEHEYVPPKSLFAFLYTHYGKHDCAQLSNILKGEQKTWDPIIKDSLINYVEHLNAHFKNFTPNAKWDLDEAVVMELAILNAASKAVSVGIVETADVVSSVGTSTSASKTEHETQKAEQVKSQGFKRKIGFDDEADEISQEKNQSEEHDQQAEADGIVPYKRIIRWGKILASLENDIQQLQKYLDEVKVQAKAQAPAMATSTTKNEAPKEPAPPRRSKRLKPE